jgi:hypothetical protein
MDLLACSECGDRFYVPGVRLSDSRGCPHCGGGLNLALHQMASIPLDARWLYSDRSSGANSRGKTRAAHPMGAS